MRGSGALEAVEQRIAADAAAVAAMVDGAPVEQRVRDELREILVGCAERAR